MYSSNIKRSIREIGTLIKIKRKTALLKSFNFHISKSTYDTVYLRIHLYTIKNGLPSEELLQKSIIVESSLERGWVNVPIHEEAIITNDDLVATVELIKAIRNSGDTPNTVLLSGGIGKGTVFGNFLPPKDEWIVKKNWNTKIYLETKTN